jgi:hypothetical protein
MLYFNVYMALNVAPPFSYQLVFLIRKRLYIQLLLHSVLQRDVLLLLMQTISLNVQDHN